MKKLILFFVFIMLALLTRLSIATAGLEKDIKDFEYSEIRSLYERYQISEESRSLYRDPTWLALNHYSRQGKTKWMSEIDDLSFFLADDGMTSPKSELDRFISLLSQNPERYFCQYPARSKWLVTALLPRAFEYLQPMCEELIRWRRYFGQKQLTIVFVSPYLKSPASIFGHTFLKFSNLEAFPDLLASTSNFSADIIDNPGTIPYILNGLSGGFNGVFDDKPMYRRMRRYLQDEGRDMWEYEVTFSEQEIERIVDHIWELKDHNFDYFFLSENCSYRIISLLATARPKQISVAKFKNLAVPLDTVKYLSDLGLIRPTKHLPSSMRAFNQQLESLTARERHLVYALSKAEIPLEEVHKLQDAASRRRVLRMSLHYTNLLIQDLKLNSVEGNMRVKELALNLNKESATTTGTPSTIQAISDITTSHGTHRLAIGASKNSDNTLSLLEFRLAGHSIRDSSQATPKHISAEYFDIAANIDGDGSGRLERFNILNIESLPPSDQFFSRRAWGLSLGARKEIDDDADRRTSVYANYRLGLSLHKSNFSFSVLGTGTIKHASFYQNYLALDFGVLAISTWQTNTLNFQLRSELSDTLSESFSTRLNSSVVATLPLTQNSALNLVFSQEQLEDRKVRESSLTLNLYF